MKRYFLPLSIFCLLTFTTSLFSQNQASKVWLMEQSNQYKAETSNIPVDLFFQQRAEYYKFASNSEMILQQEETGLTGRVHHKFQQFHDGIPVYGATYILHSQNQKVKYANGYFRPLINSSSTPTLSKEEALQKAIQEMQAESYTWDTETPTQFRKEKPVPYLVYLDPEFPELSEYIKLAYAVELSSWEPLDKKLFFIDAQTGNLILTLDKMHQHAVPATGETKYYGTQSFTVDSIAPNEFHLHDPTRGDGITTTNFDRSVFKNNSSHWDLTNENQDEIAIDAHYCSTKFHDLLKEEYNWFGIDNNGGVMETVVHLGGGGFLVNAFWNGEYAAFGDGDCQNGPLTTLEVVGHEFMHGVVDYTSELVYSKESGAINESMADVFGKMLEFKEDPSRFNWDIGRSFHLEPNLDPFRSFSDPNSRNMPAFYKGLFWSDNGGVHTNSSIGNHWFYTLSEGISGVNELGESYSVDSLGIEKAGQIAFLCNRSYLTNNSNYPDYYTVSLQAAEELFGAGAPEIAAVAEAWKAVGLPGTGSNHLRDLATTVENRTIITCETNSYLPIEFSLTNVGINTFIPESDDHITLIYNKDGTNQELDYPITEEIAPGEIQHFNVNDFLFTEGDLNIYVTIQLPSSIDENFENNNAAVFIRNYAEPNNELRLLGNVYEYDCVNETYNTNFYLVNNSCNEIPKDSEILLEIKDDAGNSYWSESLILEDAIAPARATDIYRDISLDWLPVNYQLSATLAGDPVSSNNVTEVEIWKPGTLHIDYTNNFESLGSYADSLQLGSRADPIITTYNNEQYFATTGAFQSPFFIFCSKAEDNLRGEYGDFNSLSGQITGCLDFTGVLAPEIEFDLVQFTNQNLPAPADVSSILEFTYGGTGEGKEIIYGQQEGEIVHHRIPLPDGFKGFMRFKFSDQSGVDGNQADFWDYDINLLDNIEFTSIPVATNDLQENAVRISPNPATDQLNLSADFIIQRIVINNAQGKVIPTENTFASNRLDISHLSEGFYWVTLFDSENKKTTLPFVKIRR